MSLPGNSAVRSGVGLREIFHFAEAVATLLLASLVVRLPFRLVARMMSPRSRPPVKAAKASETVLAIDRAARRLPWRTLCIHRGLTAHWMLRRRGLRSYLHYGARTGAGELAAHVWVTLDGRVVMGEAEAPNHRAIAMFPRPPG